MQTVDINTLEWRQLIDYEPGHVEAVHSHEESEIFFLVSGSMVIDEVELGTGMLVLIPGGTEYGPTIAGPEGVSFLRLHLQP